MREKAPNKCITPPADGGIWALCFGMCLIPLGMWALRSFAEGNPTLYYIAIASGSFGVLLMLFSKVLSSECGVSLLLKSNNTSLPRRIYRTSYWFIGFAIMTLSLIALMGLMGLMAL